MPYNLPQLPYEYNALEPYISEEILRIHHGKHHQTYINALNYAEEQYTKASSAKERIALQGTLRFNGGGHINHSLFWKNLAPPAERGGKGGILNPTCSLARAIEKEFGSVESLVQQFNVMCMGVQSAGWGWLAVNPASKKLEIATTTDQDPLLDLLPIIGIDVWEHAYYLQYLHVKTDYLRAIWNVVNFDEAAQRYDAAVNHGIDAAKIESSRRSSGSSRPIRGFR